MQMLKPHIKKLKILTKPKRQIKIKQKRQKQKQILIMQRKRMMPLLLTWQI